MQAPYSGDGQIYTSVIKAVSVNGKFIVAFDGYAEQEEVDVAAVRPLVGDGEGYQAIPAPKRKAVEEAPTLHEVPKWLVIRHTDDAKTKERKRKLIKSYKSKQRFSVRCDYITPQPWTLCCTAAQ